MFHESYTWFEGVALAGAYRLEIRSPSVSCYLGQCKPGNMAATALVDCNVSTAVTLTGPTSYHMQYGGFVEYSRARSRCSAAEPRKPRLRHTRQTDRVAGLSSATPPS